MGCQVNLGKVPSSRARSTRLVRYCSFRCPLRVETRSLQPKTDYVIDQFFFLHTRKPLVSLTDLLGRSELKVSILARAFYRLVANWFTTNISKSSLE